MTNDMESILLTQEQIQEKVKELSAQLKLEYADKDPIFVGDPGNLGSLPD